MDDAKGQRLSKGDIVLIPCVIKEVYPTPDYCNVMAETLGGRRPDGDKNTFSAINTRQMIRANEGDDTTYTVVIEDNKEFLAPLVDVAGYPSQPPQDNDHVAEGCHKFPEAIEPSNVGSLDDLKL